MSYRQIFYQIVFGSKNRKPVIPETHCKELYQYISGIIKTKKCKLYRIDGIEDHPDNYRDIFSLTFIQLSPCPIISRV